MVMSQANPNVKVIEEVYAAFGRGDAAAVAERCTSDTHWDFNVGPSDVPWHVPVRSRADVPAFLGAFGSNVVLKKFEPRTFIASGDQVAVVIGLAYEVKKTGKPVDEEQIHLWTLRDGRVARLRHYEDTAQVLAAHA